ncbi:MAG: alpha-amylase family glycosyl hydrolase [Candidatus Hodarchaeales archaeon]|jgi:sucrose phosphorylase
MTVFSTEKKSEIMDKLKILYGNEASVIFQELEVLFKKYSNIHKNLKSNSKDQNNQPQKFTRKDIILNCYADSIQGEKEKPLVDLATFSSRFLKNYINGIHVLPFYQWDTDRGFSVLNYYEVDERNGTWEQFSSLNDVFDVLMVDCVLNHASIDNPIVQKSLMGETGYEDFVISFEFNKKPKEEEILKIIRARPAPVLTQYFVTKNQDKYFVTFNKPLVEHIIKTGWVWTTFSRPNSSDGTVATRQVDLNFQNPKMFLEIVNIMLFYISKGANWIRLDAVGYLWKKIGTSCLHLPETHIFIELLTITFNNTLEKDITLISEVNEPQDRAIQYLGSDDVYESDMIYLFTHYPLAVHSVLTGSAKYYNNWLPSLNKLEGRLFVSVLGTHDGMGMKPIGNWLPETEKERMQKILVEEHGALPNYAKLPGGRQIIYELCSTAWNFINKEISIDSLDTQVNRYIAVFALGLMIKGVPSIYINGLLGIHNNKDFLDENRSINREILVENKIYSELNDKNSIMTMIFNKIKKLITIRRTEDSFDLTGTFKVIKIDESIVSVLLMSESKKESIFALVNVSNAKRNLLFSRSRIKWTNNKIIDLITGKTYESPVDDDLCEFTLGPYQISWLKEF